MYIYIYMWLYNVIYIYTYNLATDILNLTLICGASCASVSQTFRSSFFSQVAACRLSLVISQ